jgi:hypothetical protein
MDKNQKSLRWHRRRAYAQMSFAHANQSLDTGNNNETVTRMHETNWTVAIAALQLFLIEEREQRKNEKLP